ncbi:MAG: hypothetical protein WBA07_33230 [Rivularia sp. (in: cyanobacteria)]
MNKSDFVGLHSVSPNLLTDIKIPRKCILPASEEALMSNLFNSQSFKKTMHNACYKYRVNKKRDRNSEHS